MSDMIQRGADWLQTRLRSHGARTVTYKHGQQSVSLLATVGATRYEFTDEYGVVIEQSSRDYIITAADLVLGGAASLPQRGDTIEETVGGQTRTYEVVDLGGERHYRPADPSGRLLRIHTQEIEARA